MKRFLTILLSVAALAVLVLAPRWAAASVESRRNMELQTLANAFAGAALPACPEGEELDRFIEQRVRALRESAHSLWAPVCGKRPPVRGRVTIVEDTRSHHLICRAMEKAWYGAFQCALEEPLTFLQTKYSAESIARLETAAPDGNRYIWVTTGSLKWNAALVARFREYVVFLYLLFPVLWIYRLGYLRASLVLPGYRTRRAGPGLHPPAAPEFIIHFFCLGLSPALEAAPEDFREDYRTDCATLGKNAAGWLYRKRVLSTLPRCLVKHFHVFCARRLGMKVPISPF